MKTIEFVGTLAPDGTISLPRTLSVNFQTASRATSPSNGLSPILKAKPSWRPGDADSQRPTRRKTPFTNNS